MDQCLQLFSYYPCTSPFCFRVFVTFCMYTYVLLVHTHTRIYIAAWLAQKNRARNSQTHMRLCTVQVRDASKVLQQRLAVDDLEGAVEVCALHHVLHIFIPELSLFLFHLLSYTPPPTHTHAHFPPPFFHLPL